MALLSTIVIVAIRAFAFKLSKRKSKVFMVQLKVLFVLVNSKFVLLAYLRFKYLPNEAPETEKL